MSRNLSPNFVEQMNRQQTGEAFLKLLEFVLHENNGSTTYYRYVDDKVAITSNGEVYQAAAFNISLGSDKKGEIPTVSLRFDAGNHTVIRKLRELNQAPELNMSIIIASTPDVIDIGPINYLLENHKVSETAIEMSLIVEPILGEPIPADKYTPTLFPGLWENIEII